MDRTPGLPGVSGDRDEGLQTLHWSLLVWFIVSWLENLECMLLPKQALEPYSNHV